MVTREDLDRMNSAEPKTNSVSLDGDQWYCEEVSELFNCTLIIAQFDAGVNGFLHNTVDLLHKAQLRTRPRGAKARVLRSSAPSTGLEDATWYPKARLVGRCSAALPLHAGRFCQRNHIM